MNLNAVALEAESESDGAADQLPAEVAPSHYERIATFYKEEYPRLLHSTVNKTGSWPTAREVVDETFMKLLELNNLGAVGFLKAYAYRVTKNLATDRARTIAIRRRIHQVMKHEFPSITPSPEPTAMDEERIRLLERAMSHLRSNYRQLVKWRIWEELPYTEIQKRFAEQKTQVNERTLLRWFASALGELQQEILAAESTWAPRTPVIKSGDPLKSEPPAQAERFRKDIARRPRVRRTSRRTRSRDHHLSRTSSEV